MARRWFLGQCGLSLGGMALHSLEQPLGTGFHVRPRAKNVIFLFMAGGPSQLELFDYKPKLQQLHGQAVPESFLRGKRFAFMDSFFKGRLKLLGTTRRFARHGERGTWISELLPHTARIADKLTIVRTFATDVPNHVPAKLMLNTGSPRFGRPSMGAWVTYGIGSPSRDLPGFVVLQSGPRGPRGGSLNWASAFLPGRFQGVPFRASGDPILNLRNPRGIDSEAQRAAVDAIGALNRQRFDLTGDGEIATRIAAYEMAFRMQQSAPELIDMRGESDSTFALYGAERDRPSFATNCILARRLVERGVRFVQLYHTNWDHHGGPRENLTTDLERCCRETDRAAAALVVDLERRGLLEDTLVVWGGEFGRTPMGEPRESVGRNHHTESGALWLCGGGIRPGIDYGQTDELGFAPVAERVHVHDLHATLLHLLGIDHKRLTFPFQGRDFRLTDVHGRLLRGLLA
ncbi:MAG: DUF1501 domain-containing protein [Planctomycetes bacterium]|nr:DUF1501 domain-containing protein [Planctomycetota bacterium]